MLRRLGIYQRLPVIERGVLRIFGHFLDFAQKKKSVAAVFFIAFQGYAGKLILRIHKVAFDFKLIDSFPKFLIHAGCENGDDREKYREDYFFQKMGAHFLADQTSNL